MLIYSKIQAQQDANNAKRTMKRKYGSIRFCHHFFFLLSFVVYYVFVEDKLNMYNAMFQCVTIHSQQLNAFTYINKSVGKRLDTPSRYCVCRHAIMPTSRHDNMTAQNNDDISTWRHEVHPKLAKGEKHPTTTDSAADFEGRKSHSSLGRFLHAPLR